MMHSFEWGTPESGWTGGGGGGGLCRAGGHSGLRGAGEKHGRAWMRRKEGVGRLQDGEPSWAGEGLMVCKAGTLWGAYGTMCLPA